MFHQPWPWAVSLGFPKISNLYVVLELWSQESNLLNFGCWKSLSYGLPLFLHNAGNGTPTLYIGSLFRTAWVHPLSRLLPCIVLSTPQNNYKKFLWCCSILSSYLSSVCLWVYSFDNKIYLCLFVFFGIILLVEDEAAASRDAAWRGGEHVWPSLICEIREE